MIEFYDGPASTETRPTSVTQAAAVTTRAAARPIAPAAHLLRPEDQWDAGTLRDYVVGQITELFGAPARNPAAEIAIFRAFLDRWGTVTGVRIAKSAFGPIHRGWWNNAPIGVSRFSKGGDQYFAAEIAKTLTQAGA